MKKFKFRLEKVLEYRELVEGWAKDAYLDCRAKRLEAEAALITIDTRRKALLAAPAVTLDDRQAIEVCMGRFDDEERGQKSVIAVLEAEEGKALEEWKVRKQELEALVKLKEKALEAYNLEVTRTEQSELDEWSTTRRTA